MLARKSGVLIDIGTNALSDEITLNIVVMTPRISPVGPID